MVDEVDDLTARRRAREAEEAQSRVISGLEGDKDKAVHAMQMADNDQDAAQYAYGNYDLASTAYRSTLAQQVVENDPMLQAYFNANRMASIVSKDDISNLTKYNESMRQMTEVLSGGAAMLGVAPVMLDMPEIDPGGAASEVGREFLHGLPAAGAGVAGFGAGAAIGLATPVPGGAIIGGLVGAFAAAYAASRAEEKIVEELFPAEAERRERGREEHPWAALLGEQLAMAPLITVGGLGAATLPWRALGATITGVPELGREIYQGELDPASLIAITAGGFLFAGKPTFFGAGVEGFGRAIGTGRFVTRYFRKGEMPPVGVDKAYDSFVAEDSKEGMKIYDEAMKAAQAAETNELSPELMARLSEQHTKEGLELEWNAVNKLYGTESPTPGDGLLGDIPGVAEQFARSRERTGESIYIPWKHWTSVDPEVAKVLHDDVRLPEKLTLNEAKKVPEPSPDVITDWSPVFVKDENQQLIADTRKATGIGVPLLEPEVVPGPADETVLFKPGVILPKRQYDTMVKDIKEIADADERRRLEIQEKKAARRRAPEWNREAAEMYSEVADNIDRRPDFLAWKFMTSGELNGKPIGAIPKVDPRSLTPEQLEKFPDHWTSSRRLLAPSGLPVDSIAGLLGFRSGDDFVNNMIAFRDVKGRETFAQVRSKAIAAEVQRRMENKYGKFEDLNAAEARSHVVSPQAEGLLWHEWQALGDILELKLPYGRDEIAAMAALDFGEREAKRASLKYVTTELGRAARDTHDRWQSGDVRGAFDSRQQVIHLLAVAREAKKWETQERSGLRIAKQLWKAEPTNMDPEWAMWAHQLMVDHEVPVNREQEDIDRMVLRLEKKTFKEFVEDKNFPVDTTDPMSVGLPLGYQDFGTTYNPSMPIWEDLLKPKGLGKIYDDMNVRERKGFLNALRVLKKLGQDRSKGIVTIRDEELVAKDAAQELARSFDNFSMAKQPVRPLDMPLRRAWRTSMAAIQTMPTFVQRLATHSDTDNWMKWFIYPASEMNHNLEKRLVEVAAKINESLGSQPGWWWKKRVDNTTGIMHPKLGTPLVMDNERVVAMWLNSGTRDSIEHAAAGYKMTPDEWLAYRDSVSKPEHFEMAKKMAKVYEWAQDLEDDMTMKRSGHVSDRLPTGLVPTPWGDKAGWYWPRIRDIGIAPYSDEEIASHARNINVVGPTAPWRLERTGQVYPVKLFVNGFGDDLIRRMKYIHYLPLTDIYNKVLRRPEITDGLLLHFGQEYVKMFRDYFNDIAGVKGMPNSMDAATNHWLNSLSNKGLSNVIGFNLSTLEKHAPQSVYQSFKEVGWYKGIKETVRDLFVNNEYAGKSNRKFFSEGGTIGGREWGGLPGLQTRRKYWKQDPTNIERLKLGQMGYLESGSLTASQVGASAIGFVDQQMSTITAMTRYREQFEKLLQESTANKQLTPREFDDAVWKAHQLAADLADRAITMTHGSTSITDKPALLRSQNSTVVAATRAMTFFNNALNRRFRSIYMAADILGGRSPRPLTQDLRTISRDFFTYVVLPTVIEDTVEPICKEDDDPWLCTGKFVAQGVAAPIPILRDLVHSFITGTPVTSGMFYGMFHYGKNLGKDALKAYMDEDETKIGDITEDIMGLVGALTGFPGAVLGRWAKYFIKLGQDEEEWPEDLSELHHILRRGTIRETPHEEERKRLLMKVWEGLND